MSYRAAALKFEVCATSVLRWVRRFEERGDVRADPPRGRRSRIEEERARVFRIHLDDHDLEAIEAALAHSRDLYHIIGDCGDEYRR